MTTADTTTPSPPVLAFGAAPEPERGYWTLAHRPDALGPVRRAARASLSSWGVAPSSADAALLVVSELVTNAIRHALPPVALRLRHDPTDRCLWVEVTDGGPARVVDADPPPPDEHGRGLLLVAALALSAGVRPHPGGTVVRWACVAADRDPARRPRADRP